MFTLQCSRLNLITGYKIAGWLVGNMSNNGSVINKHMVILFTNQLNSLIYVSNKRFASLNSVPNLSVSLIFARLEKFVDTP